MRTFWPASPKTCASPAFPSEEQNWRCLARLKAEGQSILLIDKNVQTLTRIADRHYLIERGRVVWTGTSKELAAGPDVQHRYLGV